MQTMTFLLVLALASPLAARADTASVSPIGKVLEMMSGLQAKIIGEGEESQRVYSEYSEWCEEQSKTLSFQIKTAKAEAADLTAVINEETARSDALTTKIEELTDSIATDEADLKAANEIRDREAAVFAASEKDLSNIIDTLTRAVGIVEKEMAKGGAAMLQMKNARSITEALSAMVQASALNVADGQKLTALVQSSSGDDDTGAGAPAGAVYESQSGGIVDTLQGLLDKAQSQLDATRKKESDDIHNFEAMKLSLDDQIRFGKAEFAKAQKNLAASGEKKATAQGDLDVTTKDLNSDVATLNEVHHNCMTKASDFEAETKSRNEELKAIADAKKVIAETSGGADQQSYGLTQVSLLQLLSGADLQTVRFVRDLARKEHSTALTQLAARMAAASTSRNGDDPFAKIKGLIADMVSKLEKEAEEDATHEAFCDKEIAESNVKHEDKTEEFNKLSTQIDSMSNRATTLKGEVAALQKALADLAASQSEMDNLRNEEHTDYVSNKAEMKKGLDGVQLALKILTEYYAQDDKAHSSADGAGGGIIGLLEVIESDFSKNLAEIVATEESAQHAYDVATKQNEIDKANKDQDVKYKNKEANNLEKAVGQDTSDRAGVQTELDAINEYLADLHKECDEKVEPYAETKRRRESELAGLREALQILEGEAVLLQRKSSRRHHLRQPLSPA